MRIGSILLNVCLAFCVPLLTYADVGDAAGKDKHGQPVGDAVEQLKSIHEDALASGTVLLWVDMYHEFVNPCTRKAAKKVRRAAKRLLASLSNSEVFPAIRPENLSCAPGFPVRATMVGVEELWAHRKVRSLGQLSEN